MSSSLTDLLVGVRSVMTNGFRNLPTLLGGMTLFLGLTQGNFNFLFFFTGMFLLTPVAVFILNGLIEVLFGYLLGGFISPQLWQIPQGTAEACALFPGGGTPIGPMNSAPSMWLSTMAFFITYLILNAHTLYKKQENSKAPAAAVTARKSQAITSMAITGILGLAVFAARGVTSHCETFFGFIVSAALGGGLAYGWYEFMKSCGLGRLDDLFGISNRILPLQSYEDQEPTVCVPDEAATTK